jgi:multicomponent Na+:H+ antiporter subunit D
MNSLSYLYLLVFAPLISAVICQTLPLKKLAFWFTLFCSIAIFALVLALLPQVLTFKNIGNDFNLSLLSLSLEFRIDILGYFFLTLVLFLKIVILIFYHADVEKLLNAKNIKTFYAVFLINLFGLINIFTTNNLFNLFVFLEIYAFSFFAISALAKDSELLKISFRDFCLNATASLLILFSFLITYLVFKNNSFDQIITNSGLFAGSKSALPLVIMLFLAIAFLIKFFPFWLFFDKMKSANILANFLVAESMFVKGAVGMFLLLKFIYFYFGTKFLFAEFGLNYFFIIAAIILVVLSAIGVYQQKHLNSICGYLCLGNIGFVIAAIGLSTQESVRSIFFYILNFSLVNLFIFIFATFLKQHFESSSFSKIPLIKKDVNFVAILPIKLMVFFIASFPLTPLFFANWNITYASLNPGLEASILIALVAANFAYVDLALRFIDALFGAQENSTDSIEKPKYNRFYFLAFWILLIVIVAAVFLAVFVNNLSEHFASYLLSV